MVKHKYTISNNTDEITATGQQSILWCNSDIRIDNQPVFFQTKIENGNNVSPSFMI